MQPDLTHLVLKNRSGGEKLLQTTVYYSKAFDSIGIHSLIHQRLDCNFGSHSLSLFLSLPSANPSALPPYCAAGGSCSEWFVSISYSLIQM